MTYGLRIRRPRGSDAAWEEKIASIWVHPVGRFQMPLRKTPSRRERALAAFRRIRFAVGAQRWRRGLLKIIASNTYGTFSREDLERATMSREERHERTVMNQILREQNGPDWARSVGQSTREAVEGAIDAVKSSRTMTWNALRARSVGRL